MVLEGRTAAVKTDYRVWKVKGEFKFRLGTRVHSVDWSLTRERELTLLLARWQEHEKMSEEAPDGE
jgi:hypothetical protein